MVYSKSFSFFPLLSLHCTKLFRKLQSKAINYFSEIGELIWHILKYLYFLVCEEIVFSVWADTVLAHYGLEKEVLRNLG